MTRETVPDKAARYLAEGRLTVTWVRGDYVVATCEGDSGKYRLGHQPGRGWHCDCPVRNDRCSHLIALELVTVRRAGPQTASPRRYDNHVKGLAA